MASSSSLPPGWTKEFSQKQQRPYYYHAATKKSVWKLEDLPSVPAAPAPPPKPEAVVPPPTLHSDVDKFRASVMSRLEALTREDGSEAEKETKAVFDTVSGQFRYIIHEVADDLDLPVLDEWVPLEETERRPSQDEEEEVHEEGRENQKRVMIVYRRGCEPQKEEETVVAPVGNTKKRKRAAPPPPPPPQDTVLLGTTKRDRRTIEEIQLEKTR